MPDIHKASALSPALPVGTTLGNYIIRKVIGSGGFGITYLAQEEITDKLIVIKENYPAEISFRDMTSLMVGPSGESRKEAYDWALKRFLDEAKILSRLSHPNIVPIQAAFKALGTAYYVMPHVEGTDLHKAAPAPDNITAEWLLPVLEKILSALGYLHSQGLIHRDIKPNNILLREDGEPILIDFGTARALESTHSHSHIGTPGYMPLEQLSAGGKRGPWTDFYALGATCYHLITGELPPSSTERADEGEYLPLTGRASLAERFPEHVLSSIDKALNMKRLARWQSAQEWLAALKTQQSVASAPVQTAPQTPPTPVKQVQPETIPPTLTREQAQEELARLGIYSREYNNTLRSAAEKGEAHLITLLIAAGADVNVADDYGWTPLSWAANKGHTECVRLLLAAPGIDVNKPDKNGWTPLSWAADMGRTECVRLLLAAPGININQATQHGATPLSWAAQNGHTECVRLLLAAPGININQANQYGYTPLILAARWGRTECVRLLIDAPGIDINKARSNGYTPLIWAAQNGHKECVRLLLAAPGIDVNKADENGNTPLYWAAYDGHTECVRLLLAAQGININQATQSGRTPLSEAADKGHTECVRLLLAAQGININQANQHGETPLFWAALRGHTECVRLLLAAQGIDVNKPNKDGETPLSAATGKGHTECARLIRAAGETVHSSLTSEQAQEELKRLGISSDTYNDNLLSAAKKGEAHILTLLITAGADVNVADDFGFTPLYWAAYNGHTECVRLLLAAPGIDVNKTNQNGDTPLICAAGMGHTECVRLLLAAPGIDVNKPEKNGWTPLIGAANMGHTECVRLLLAAPRIDVNKAYHDGKTPLYYAEKYNHNECARLIRAAGGKKPSWWKSLF